MIDNTNTNREKLERKRRKSAISDGILAFIISAAFILFGIFFLAELESVGGMIVMFIIALLFAAAGVYFFNRIKIEEKRSRALDDPNSKAYKKHHKKIAKKREKYLLKAENHGSLRSILCFRAAMIRGFIAIYLFFLSMLFLSISIIAIGMLILDISFIVAFISSIIGIHYRKIIKQYAIQNVDKAEAELDFAQSRVYRFFTDTISVSSSFIVSTSENLVIPIGSVVWIFSGYDKIYKYKSGAYSHAERKYFVLIGTSNGLMFKIYCPEELYSVIIDDVRSVGISVTVGYSDKLWDLFRSAPDKFRNSIKPTEDITTEPISPDK